MNRYSGMSPAADVDSHLGTMKKRCRSKYTHCLSYTHCIGEAANKTMVSHISCTLPMLALTSTKLFPSAEMRISCSLKLLCLLLIERLTLWLVYQSWPLSCLWWCSRPCQRQKKKEKMDDYTPTPLLAFSEHCFWLTKLLWLTKLVTAQSPTSLCERACVRDTQADPQWIL